MLIGRLDYSRESDVVVYLRVPKTGSSSLSRMLSNVVGADRSHLLPDRQVDALNSGAWRMHDQLRRWGMRRRDQLARAAGTLAGRPDPIADALFLHGHHPLWARLPTRRRPLFITMTRDPVERFLSNYYFIRARAERGGSSQLKRAVLVQEPDEFVGRLVGSPAVGRLNGMCLYLARSGRFEEAREAVDKRLFAAARLEDIVPFGRLLARELDVPEPPIRHENAGQNRPHENPLSPKVEAVLRAALEPDRRLHDYVGEVSRPILA